MKARPRVLVASWAGSSTAQRLLDGARESARAHDVEWDIEVLPHPQTDTMRLALESGDTDGVITSFSAPAILESLRGSSMPAVFLRFDADDPPLAGRKRLSVLRLDFAAAGRAAARHFLDFGGFRSFAFVEATRDPGWSVSRGDAFGRAVEAAGQPFFRFSAAGGIYQASVAHRSELSELGAWLQSLPRPVAVFAASDERARDTILACREAGLDVPRAVSVLGVNNDEFTCRHIFPNLSSIELDHAALGRAAADELLRLFDAKRPRRRAFPVPVLRLAPRASTGPSSPGGMLVRRALDFIEARAFEGIGAADVVRHVGVSRSLLDLRFRELEGRSVLDALQDRRMREVCRRLRETTDSIETICRAVGYGDTGGLRRLFKRRFGLSMSAFRRAGAKTGPERRNGRSAL